MNINGNYGNMPGIGHKPNFPPNFIPLPIVLPDCPPKGGTIPNFHAPKGMDTINYFGVNGHDLINYHGAYKPKTYTMHSYNCPPGVYNMVDVNWCAPHYPQPIYHPMPIHGSKGCATC